MVAVTAGVIAHAAADASGTLERSAISAFTSSAARAGWSFRRLFALVTYALWCLPWWISIVRASMCGSRAVGA